MEERRLLLKTLAELIPLINDSKRGSLNNIQSLVYNQSYEKNGIMTLKELSI
jgi:hypothetical protein